MGFIPLTNNNISAAAQMWVLDNEQALIDYGPIEDWDTSQVTNMNQLFWRTETFNSDVSKWDVSNVTDMGGLFETTLFNGDVSSWNTSKVKAMDGTFCDCPFNRSLATWDLSNVTSSTWMFYQNHVFNGDVSTWNVGNLRDAGGMFDSAFLFNGDVSKWDVSNLRAAWVWGFYIFGMFEDAHSFNGDVSNWNVSNVTSMQNMFRNCYKFNQDVSKWNAPNCSNYTSTFDGCIIFNSPVPLFGQSIAACSSMFSSCYEFNQPVRHFNMTQNVSVALMFYRCVKFNQPVDWDNFKPAFVNDTLSTCRAFNQPLNSWDMSGVTALNGTLWDCVSFNQPLDNWDVSRVTTMFGFLGNFYGGTFNGREKAFNQPLNSWDVANVNCFFGAFQGCSRFNQPLDNWVIGPQLPYDTFNPRPGLYAMFDGCSSFNQPLNSWNITGSAEDLTDMFYGASSFNQPLDKWDVSSISAMSGMFDGASSFNQPLDTFDVSNSTSLDFMFYGASSFNQPLESWNVANVTSASAMFFNASSFNQPLDSWNVSRVENFGTIAGIFENSSFNQPLDSWDVSNVTSMEYMFAGTPFTHWDSIHGWNYRTGVEMGSFFYGTSYNEPFDWSTKLTNMSGLFRYALEYNQPVENWDMSSVRKLGNRSRRFYEGYDIGGGGMFSETAYNQPLEAWDISSVTDMSEMFRNSSFNQPLANWNTDNLLRGNLTFSKNNVFNQSLGQWNVPVLLESNGMLSDTTSMGYKLLWDVNSSLMCQDMYTGSRMRTLYPNLPSTPQVDNFNNGYNPNVSLDNLVDSIITPTDYNNDGSTDVGDIVSLVEDIVNTVEATGRSEKKLFILSSWAMNLNEYSLHKFLRREYREVFGTIDEGSIGEYDYKDIETKFDRGDFDSIIQASPDYVIIQGYIGQNYVHVLKGADYNRDRMITGYTSLISRLENELPNASKFLLMESACADTFDGIGFAEETIYVKKFYDMIQAQYRVPVCEAFRYIYENYNESFILLYGTTYRGGLMGQSVFGTYVTACVTFVAITGRSAFELPVDIDGLYLTEERARQAREAADHVVISPGTYHSETGEPYVYPWTPGHIKRKVRKTYKKTVKSTQKRLLGDLRRNKVSQTYDVLGEYIKNRENQDPKAKMKKKDLLKSIHYH